MFVRILSDRTHGAAPHARSRRKFLTKPRRYIPAPKSAVSGGQQVAGRTLPHVRRYSLVIACGLWCARRLAEQRAERKGYSREQIRTIATVAIPSGIVGTRMYHVATDWRALYSNGRWWPTAFQLWKGGLGIPGGIFLGVVGGDITAKAVNMPVLVAMDCVAPAFPLGQAIGRWGNYFNQEIFGYPTTVPWALEVDPEARPERYRDVETFHPTFLYESLWNMGLCGGLILVDNTGRLKPGKLFAMYLGGYFLGRGIIENMRTDQGTKLWGIRWNFLFSLAMVAVSGVWLAAGGLTVETDDVPADGPTPTTNDDASPNEIDLRTPPEDERRYDPTPLRPDTERN